MKKIIVGAIVGGILIFTWHFLSWVILDLHRPANQHTPKQNEIMTFLNSQFTEDGSYLLPSTPPDASNEEMEKSMSQSIGKPWAVIAYHKEMEMKMGMSMFRAFITDVIIVGLLCWILSAFANPRFGNVFVASLLVGFIGFLNIPYTIHIWFDTFDLAASLTDALVAWGLVGLWLGWWYGRKQPRAAV